MGCFGKILTETKLNFCTLKASLDYCVPCGVLYHVEYAYHLRWQLYYMLFIVVVIRGLRCISVCSYMSSNVSNISDSDADDVSQPQQTNRLGHH